MRVCAGEGERGASASASQEGLGGKRWAFIQEGGHDVCLGEGGGRIGGLEWYYSHRLNDSKGLWRAILKRSVSPDRLTPETHMHTKHACTHTHIRTDRLGPLQ